MVSKWTWFKLDFFFLSFSINHDPVTEDNPQTQLSAISCNYFKRLTKPPTFTAQMERMQLMFTSGLVSSTRHLSMNSSLMSSHCKSTRLWSQFSIAYCYKQWTSTETPAHTVSQFNLFSLITFVKSRRAAWLNHLFAIQVSVFCFLREWVTFVGMNKTPSLMLYLDFFYCIYGR